MLNFWPATWEKGGGKTCCLVLSRRYFQRPPEMPRPRRQPTHLRGPLSGPSPGVGTSLRITNPESKPQLPPRAHLRPQPQASIEAGGRGQSGALGVQPGAGPALAPRPPRPHTRRSGPGRRRRGRSGPRLPGLAAVPPCRVLGPVGRCYALRRRPLEACRVPSHPLGLRAVTPGPPYTLNGSALPASLEPSPCPEVEH
ncbi:RNA-binding protein 27-like [Equus caballus]|uniref:RNA-binding protein 27-like n=1 Tax=Equus caballus TaxID=9796 RepID=UPI0038B4072A